MVTSKHTAEIGIDSFVWTVNIDIETSVIMPETTFIEVTP